MDLIVVIVLLTSKIRHFKIGYIVHTAEIAIYCLRFKLYFCSTTLCDSQYKFIKNNDI